MITLRDVHFSYGPRAFTLNVRRLDVAAGERVALIGPSGCGKSTLIGLIAGLLKPARGAVHVADQPLHNLSEAQRRRFRATRVGFVFQAFELLEYLTVADNVALPLRLAGRRFDRPFRQRRDELVARLGLETKLRRRPAQLSFGEQQRVAIARALIAAPDLIIADEPTGNLDPATAERTLDLLLGVAGEHGATLLLVTHNHGLLDRFDRTLDVAGLAAERAR